MSLTFQGTFTRSVLKALNPWVIHRNSDNQPTKSHSFFIFIFALTRKNGPNRKVEHSK